MLLTSEGLPDSWTIPPALRPFLAIGVAAIVAGGVAAALTAPTDWHHGSWVAAFLVLVVGIGQIGLGAGQALLAETPSRRRLVAETALFNAGCAVVIAGTLASVPAAVSGGGAMLVGGLVAFARVPRRSQVAHRWPARVYALLLVVLVVSTPVGLALSWIRA